MKKLFILVLFATAILQACYYDNFDEIHPVDSTEPNFLARIKHETSVSQSKWMPKPSGKLTDCEIQKIENWFTQGRLNN